MTTYTATYNLPSIKRGDTLDPWSVKATVRETGAPLVPLSVCAQLRDERGRVVIPLPHGIAPDGTVTLLGLPAQATAGLKAGLYRYDVEYTLTGGRVRTYLQGALDIQEDVSQCHAP